MAEETTKHEGGESNRLGGRGSKAAPKELTKAEKLKQKAALKADNAEKVAAAYKAKYPAFDPDEKLPAAVKDKKGKVVKAGEARYRVERSGAAYKLIAVYRNRSTGSKLVAILKPGKKNAKGAKDRALLKELKANGVPGAE